MKKTELQNIIINNIRNNVGLIDRTEHAAVEDALLNSLYGVFTEIADTDITDTIFTKIENITYQLSITKIGGIVHINGVIGNFTGSLIQGLIFDIINDEYKPITNFSENTIFPYTFGVVSYISPNGAVIATLPNNQYTIVSLTYKTAL